MRTRQDLIQLALWGSAVGCLIMAIRTALFSARPGGGADADGILVWGIAFLAIGTVAFSYSLAHYLNRPH